MSSYHSISLKSFISPLLFSAEYIYSHPYSPISSRVLFSQLLQAAASRLLTPK